MKSVVAVCLLAAVGLAGCGSSRSILYSGVSPGFTGKKIVITDDVARSDGRSVREEWMHDITLQGRRHPLMRFENLSRSMFRQRLEKAASRYGFKVETVRFLHPRQLAPLVIMQTRDYLGLSKAIPAIERSIDPGSDRGAKHAAFEALYLEGEDERGVPFVIVSDEFRGEVMGGQWARSEALYPFAHG